MKTLVAALAAVGIGLAAAPTASADEQGFIAAVDSLGHYATTAPGTADEAVVVGYRACAGFDNGGSAAAVRAVRQAYNGDTSESADYYATLFAQQAAYNLCPQHLGAIGPI